MAYQGDQNTVNYNQDRRVMDMSEEVLMLDPNRAPFTVLTRKKGGTRDVHNPKFYWQEDKIKDYLDSYTGTDESSNGENTTIDVNDASLYLQEDLVEAPTISEIMLVTAVDTTNDQIDVQRGYANTSAGMLSNGDALQIIGNANMEGSGSRGINQTTVQNPHNFSQIFKKEVGMTGTQRATKQYGGDEWARLRKKKGIEFKEDKERAYLFGERFLDTSGENPRRTTRGLLNWITTNVADMSGSMTETDFDNFLVDKAFAHGSDKKVMLASGSLIATISGWAKDNIQTRAVEELYGMYVGEYISPSGKRLDIIEHKLFTGPYSSFGAVVDMETVKEGVLRDTKLKTNIQNNDADKQEDQWLCETGLQVEQEERNAIIKNF